MSKHFFAFSNVFQKRSSSTQQLAPTNKLDAYSLILVRIRLCGIMLLSCSRVKFII